jgi:hypothetical protein
LVADTKLVGESDGLLVGFRVGFSEGLFVGKIDGFSDGFLVGTCVGIADGTGVEARSGWVGFSVGQ